MTHPLSASAAKLAGALDIDTETIQGYADDALTRPSDSAWWDPDMYVTHTLMFATPDWNLTTEYIDSEANYRAALRDLTADYPRQVEAATFSHWTYSRYTAVKVQVLTKRGNITPAFVAAVGMTLAIRDYPLLDEDTYSGLEWEVWESTITSMLDDLDRELARNDEPTLTDAQRDHVTEYLSEKYGVGYWGHGYIPDETFSEAVEIALDPARQQHHQESTLY